MSTGGGRRARRARAQLQEGGELRRRRQRDHGRECRRWIRRRRCPACEGRCKRWFWWIRSWCRVCRSRGGETSRRHLLGRRHLLLRRTRWRRAWSTLRVSSRRRVRRRHRIGRRDGTVIDRDGVRRRIRDARIGSRVRSGWSRFPAGRIPRRRIGNRIARRGIYRLPGWHRNRVCGRRGSGILREALVDRRWVLRHRVTADRGRATAIGRRCVSTSGAGATSPVVVVSGPAGLVTDASSTVAGEAEDGSTGGTPVKSGDEAAAKLAWARNAHAATVTSAIHDRVAQIVVGKSPSRTSGTSSDSKNTQPRGAPGEPGTWAQTTSEDVPCQLPTWPDGQGNSPGSRSERERHLAQDASTWHWRHELCGGPGVLGDDRERAIDLLLARTAHRASPALIGTCASPCPDRYFVVEPNALDLPPVESDRDDGGKPVQDTYPRHLPPLLQLD